MSYSLNGGCISGLVYGSITRVLKGDTWSLDYSSYKGLDAIIKLCPVESSLASGVKDVSENDLWIRTMQITLKVLSVLLGQVLEIPQTSVFWRERACLLENGWSLGNIHYQTAILAEGKSMRLLISTQ